VTNLSGTKPYFFKSLLRVEDGIAAELRRAREQFVKQRQTTDFLPGMELVPRQGALDLSGMTMTASSTRPNPASLKRCGALPRPPSVVRVYADDSLRAMLHRALP
jgi:hypothetical protein